MKILIRLEELAMFAVSLVLFLYTGVAWWWFLVFLFVPDIAMLGYLSGPSVGAVIYNFAHHKAVALTIAVSGFFLDMQYVYLCGLILFAHSSMDRFFGYGLKLKEGFHFTHLGNIGN
ncbi:MAG: DUF4260 domain-containing protein [Cyclobacteriaceae bacterium]|nr:DUF4260 domain-containing protein [Cyclobacteriaceae bacterium]